MPSRNTNLFTDIPAKLPEEIFTTLLETDALKIERIVSYGQSSAKDFWYEQSQNEWVLLLEGEARIEFADGTMHHLEAGDFINIPAQKKHRVDWTLQDRKTIWLAIFY